MRRIVNRRRRRRMPGLLDICQDLFGSNDLYEILGVKKESTAKEGNVNLIILTTFNMHQAVVSW